MLETALAFILLFVIQPILLESFTHNKIVASTTVVRNKAVTDALSEALTSNKALENKSFQITAAQRRGEYDDFLKPSPTLAAHEKVK